MERIRKGDYSKVKESLKNFFTSSTLKAEKLRGTLIGAIISITMAEVSAYRLLKQNVKAGDLPPYITDLLIVLLGVCEVGVAPFVGYFGYKWRRMIMIMSCAVAGLVGLFWFILPDVDIPASVGYCNSNSTLIPFKGGPNTGIRLSIILFTFIVFGITRLLIWCHGMVYIDEHSPSRMAMHYGVLSSVRMLSLVLGYDFMSELVETHMVIQILIIVIGLLVNAAQVAMNVPKVTPSLEDPAKGPSEELCETSPFVPKVPSSKEIGVTSSLSRVFSNSLVMSQMVAMGLIVAALWGFGYHRSEILKAKFYLHLARDKATTEAEAIAYLAVMLAIAYQGLKFTPPIMERVVKKTALVTVAKMCVFAIIFYALSVFMTKCDGGQVAGLAGHYEQPQCSQSCGCSPQWEEFSPVCLVDQMTTYLSPCHAGCTGTEEVEGITVYANCTCGPVSQRAISGACNLGKCNSSVRLHQMIFTVLFIFSALACQSLGVVILRECHVRDKAAALGMTCAVVALFAFVCGHLIFLGISAGSCVWWEGGRCHLQSQWYPYLVSGVSSAMMLFAFTITLTTIIFMHRAEKKAAAETDMDLRDVSRL